jgi:hypothetical protein
MEPLFKWAFLCGLVISLLAYFSKDTKPDPSFYDSFSLDAPIQTPTTEGPFNTTAEDQHYTIEPKFDYELDGVIVSYNDADSIFDIWHHDKWKDYLNVRDVCVIWGANVRNGVYLSMKFSNDSWTCWVYWPDQATGSRFDMTALSNNHLLVDDVMAKNALMSAETGDYIHLKGMLVSYHNPGNGFSRGTSAVRTDTGNGACETVYLREFEVIKKANAGVRSIYKLAKWFTMLAMLGYGFAFFNAPAKQRYK